MKHMSENRSKDPSYVTNPLSSASMKPAATIQSIIGNQAFGKYIQMQKNLSFEAQNKVVLQKMSKSDWYQTIGDIIASEESTEAKQEYVSILASLVDKGWELQEDDSTEHCYTVINGKYVEDNWPTGEGDDWELDGDSNLSVTYSKIVFYNKTCPLIDLKHEYDHVLQMEKISENRKKNNSETKATYLPIDWSYYVGGEEVGYEHAKSNDLQEGYDIWMNPDVEEAHKQMKKVFKGDDLELLTRLSKDDNDVVEYHTYMRELIRMDVFQLGTDKQEEIITKIDQHKENAKKRISSFPESEVVIACNDIQPFEELEKNIEEIKVKIEEIKAELEKK